MRLSLLISLLCIIGFNNTFAQTDSIGKEKVIISGYLTDSTSREALLYAGIYIAETNAGVTTNEYGFYSIPVPKNQPITLVFTYLGYNKKSITLQKSENFTLNVGLSAEGQSLEVVEVIATKSAAQMDVQSTSMSKVTIQVEQVKNLPSIGGEVDLIKVAQLLPGIQKGGEGGTGMFVRGGDADQNLVLLDEATVYNVGHLFGFFSVFNPDAIKDMTILKGAFPANYGGRLSSVLDLRMKEGHKQRFAGEGGIGLLSSRLTLEAPIVKDKASFLISGRRTYIDQILKIAKVNVPYYFYDIYAKLNWTISDKDRLYFSSYFGQDVLKFKQEITEGDSLNNPQSDSLATGTLGFGFDLGNFTQTLRWNHVFSPRLFMNVSLIHTMFNYNIRGSFVGNSILIKSSIRDIGLKVDFSQYQSDNLRFKFGLHSIVHNFRPNIISTQGDITEFLADQKGDIQTTFENSLYGNADWDITEKWKLSAGLRLSSAVVKKGFYWGVEPRLALAFNFHPNHSFKLSYSRMYQYMHLVSSSTVALPTDLWYPVSKQVAPQNCDQIAGAYNWYIPQLEATIVVEGYYKWMRNLIEYKEASNLILNDNFEDLLLQGKGHSYGAEFLFKKDFGRVNGWVGYTLSWTKRQFDGLNNGEPFWAKYDRRHYLTVVLNAEIARWFSISAVWEYASGARFTPIIGQYVYPNSSLTEVEIIPIYAERNSVRMSDSHRLDLNLVFRTKPHKKWKYFINEFCIGAYNVYNRAAPFRINVTIDPETGKYKYTQPGLFGFLPSVAWNFKF